MAEAWKYAFVAAKTSRGIVFQARNYYERVISTLGDGEELTVTVEKKTDKRTVQMNRALWGPIYDQLIAGIAESVGYEPHDKAGKEQLHEGLLALFGGTVIDPITKREVAKERSSTMTIARFGEFMEWIARWAAEEHGVVITLPGER